MASINKRLRYFSTEQEYQAFYNQQKQACDDGTLELLETTVCCITHGDPDTPDEYLPSHDAGDEDKLMHYNANDEIRYIPFINPMWTTRGIYINNGVPINAMLRNVTLPDVIDGNQLTQLPGDFVFYLNSFPSFSIKNITTFTYKSRQNLNIPSVWPSLTKLDVVRISGFEFGKIPIFADGLLDAPNLQQITYDAWLSINDFPALTSQNIESLRAYFTDSVIDINSKLVSTQKLKGLLIQSSSAGITYPSYRCHRIHLSYDGSYLNAGYISLCGSNNNRVVELDITGNTQNINIGSLGLYDCDLSLSTISDLRISGSSSNRLVYLVDCNASASSLQQVTSWLSAGGGIAKLTGFTNVYFLRCAFNEYIIEPDGRYVTDISTDSATLPNVVYNCNESSWNVNFRSSGTGVNDLTINGVDQEGGNLVISGRVKRLIIPDGKIVGYTITVPNTVESISALTEWYCPSGGSGYTSLTHTSASNVFNFFRLHVSGLELTVSNQLNVLNLVLEHAVSGETYSYGILKIVANADISTCNISFPVGGNGVDYIRRLEISFNKNVSLQTVINVITAIGPAFTAYSVVPNVSTLTIYAAQYNAIEQDYPAVYDIIRKFKTVDIITV